MTKQQRLRTTAEGFMAGLVVCGFRGPWRWSHLDWELPFYRVWRQWPPQQRTPERFPTFQVGGHGGKLEAREMLWQLKRTSPFHDAPASQELHQPNQGDSVPGSTSRFGPTLHLRKNGRHSPQRFSLRSTRVSSRGVGLPGQAGEAASSDRRRLCHRIARASERCVSQPPRGARNHSFSLVGRLARDGWTRIGSPGSFGSRHRRDHGRRRGEPDEQEQWRTVGTFRSAAPYCQRLVGGASGPSRPCRSGCGSDRAATRDDPSHGHPRGLQAPSVWTARLSVRTWWES